MNLSDTATETTARNLVMKIEGVTSAIQYLLDKKIGISDPIFRKEMEKLEQIARASAYNYFFRFPDERLAECQKIGREIFDRYETGLEKLEAQKILDTPEKNGFLSSSQLKRTFDFALEEAAALEINEKSSVCFVGGGYLPESAVAISLNFHCPITVLDKNPEAVEISRKVIEILGLEKNIQIITANAEEYDFGNTDAVWVAVMAKDKNKILNRVRLTNPTAKIACRTVRGSRTLLYEPVNERLFVSDLKKREINSSNPETIMHSLILT